MSRAVLLGFYGLKEDSEWIQADAAIATIQNYKSADFPNKEDIADTTENLKL